jgi:hypothetical protein
VGIPREKLAPRLRPEHETGGSKRIGERAGGGNDGAAAEPGHGIAGSRVEQVVVAPPSVFEPGLVAPACRDGAPLKVEKAVQVAPSSVADPNHPTGPLVPPSDVAARIDEKAGCTGGLQRLAGQVDSGSFGDCAESKAKAGAALHRCWRQSIKQLQGIQTDLS